jgi:FixJ family two-component response regulator
LSGPELQSRLIELGSILPIIFVTGHADTPTTVRAIKAGAEDFLTKPASSEQLIDAIERAMARYESLRGQQSKLESLRALVATLTPRERQVLGLIVRGKINKQIAFELGTTERTVKAHRHQVMEKMQVRSLAELVSIAEHLGMLNAGR